MSLNLVQHAPGVGGDTLIFSYIYVGSGHFIWFKILNFNIFEGFQRMNINFVGV